MHVLYSVAIVVLAVVLSPWFLYQAIRYRKYIGSVAQRMGYLPVSFNLDGDDSIWIHAVSVGEVLSTRGKVRSLFEKKGKEFVEADLVLVAGERRPIAHVLHTAIYRLPSPAR